MKYSENEIKQAIQDSVEHWQRDIIEELEKGREIERGVGVPWEGGTLLLWKDTGEAVDCYDDDCALCQLEGYGCVNCPYYIFYEFRCSDVEGHWTAFDDEPNLENAKAMKQSLQKLLNHLGGQEEDENQNTKEV